MALRLGFIGIVTRDMSASLAFYRLLGAPVPDGSDESHVDIRLEDGIVLAWDTIDLIRSLDPGYESYDLNLIVIILNIFQILYILPDIMLQ